MEMKWWINIALFIVLIVLVLPTIIVNGFSKREIQTPPPEEEIHESIEIQKEEVEPLITMYNHYEKKLMEMPIEEYVAGVVAAEMPASFEHEALKAQAVAARTLAARKLRTLGGSGCSKHAGADVCSEFSHCQAWIPEEQRRKNWKNDYETNSNKIIQAVIETRGEIMTYAGEPIEVFFFSTSNGKTEDVSEVFSASLPYYTVVDSPGEEEAPRYKGTVSLTKSEFINKINNKYGNCGISEKNLESQVKITSYTESGRVRNVKVGNVTIEGTDFRSLLGLNSADFSIQFEGNNINIHTTGYGHGVGMSQMGANQMAQEGSSYSEILHHYYKGINVEKIQQ
jgi:stage II sporulation protein D